ncbi:MAG: response regulator [Oscillatoriales cyanobacterium C42_A2020_001]|nr:response regulator [Leptolyngbyaceae cyanobacterium C42_A2020_001]
MSDPVNNVILVVDDNPTNLEVLSEALIDAGFEVGVATSGEGAIKQIQYNPPDLVLLDVMMPGISGFETCHRLKSNPATQETPIIFMTALSEPVNKVKGLSLGAVDYITKPFQQEEVLARVKVHLQLRQLHHELAERNRQLKHLTENLEQTIAERTATLEQTQVQLVQSEKLSSLGQLVAGVAHEINNPIGCISSNLAPAKEYVTEIIRILQCYQQRYAHLDAELAAEAAAVDLDFMLEDLPKILHSIESSAVRIRDISTSLRNFSRSDATYLVAVNIHEGLDSTLMILHHRLKACGDRPEIQVVKHYGQIPLVECYPGQVNQVLMNLLSNAIDALEDDLKSNPTLEKTPTITISTEQSDLDHIRVRIADNGPGIAESILQNLFQPFFTTKSVGKGTGLGLSISRQIIQDKHHGNLRCCSKPGEGTEFCVEIPVLQKAIAVE